MIVKFMSGEIHLEDIDTRKQCVMVANITAIEFRRHSDGQAIVKLSFKDDVVPDMMEGFTVVEGLPIAKNEYALFGNVYVMSDEGKTIQKFSHLS